MGVYYSKYFSRMFYSETHDVSLLFVVSVKSTLLGEIGLANRS